MNQEMPGGGKKREHLENIERQTGKQQIPDFEIPIEGEHIWNWFWDLSKRRPPGFGPASITYNEIRAWLEIRKPLIYDWEMEILLKMDDAFMESVQEATKEKKEKKPAK